MSKNLFAKAVEDATFTVTKSPDGSRSFRAEEPDRPTRGRFHRGYSRGRGRGRGRGNYRTRGSFPHPRSHLGDDDDDDIRMYSMDEGLRSDSRFNPYRSRPLSRRGGREGNNNRGDIKSRLGAAPFNKGSSGQDWFKVVIIEGQKHDKEWLIRKLQNACEEAFQPIDFHIMKGDSVAFFVEGSKAAEALKKVSHKITVRDGSKLIFTVRSSGAPHNPNSVFTTAVDGSRGNTREGNNTPDDNTKEILKHCLGKRYDVMSKALNLSDLFHDEVLNEHNVQGALSKPWLASRIVQIIGENCPEVLSLDLSNNKLRNLDGFKDLGQQASNLKHLKVCNNQLRAVEDLDKIKSLSQLTSLELDGNPLCDMFQNKGSNYINSVRSRLPKITFLDGHELPPPIGFDLPSQQALPPSKDSFFCDPQIQTLVLKFLEQYFKIYDTEDRQDLLDAYHDQAIFSMCVHFGTMSKDRSAPRGPSLGEYLKNSRNMMRVTEPERRVGLLKHSRLSVVAFLNELPATKHDWSTFTVDVSLALPTCLSFAVRGLFMENSKTLRSFSRVFVAVPGSGGKALSIINDELHVRNASPAQVERFANETSASSTEKVSAEVFPVSCTPQQQEMLLKFSQQSTMNLEWSFKCLKENNWDYGKAAHAFTSLKSNGSIPPQAFIKSS